MDDQSNDASVPAGPRRRDLLLGGGAVAAAAGIAAVGLAQPAGAVAPVQIPVYSPFGPVRYFDTRDPDGGGPISGGEAGVITPTVKPPATEVAWLFNVTVVDTVGGGYLAVFSDDLSAWPGNSSVNWYTNGQIVANNAFSAIGSTDGGIVVLAGGGSTDFVLDLVGKSILTDVSSAASVAAMTAAAPVDPPKGVLKWRGAF